MKIERRINAEREMYDVALEIFPRVPLNTAINDREMSLFVNST